MLTEKHIDEGSKYPTLGPAYFCSREVVERAMEGVQSSDFKPLLDRFSKEFTDTVWTSIQDHLLSDTEMNLQGAMWRQVDDIVKYLLSGEKWAVEKYALGARHDCEKVREAVARAVPKELQDMRIADLEAEVLRLKDSLRFYQR